MIKATVSGIPDLREALRGIVPKLRVRALRNALAAGARIIQKAARASTPVIRPTALAVRKGYRKPGTVRKAISVRTSKVARKAGNVGVFVNVRPEKKGRRGAKVPTDPYYWRWVNFGAKHIKPFGFLEKGAAKLPEALAVFIAKISPAIQKLNKPKAPAP